MMDVSEGQLLAGKFRVERVLGQGGMGVVVAAHHIVLDEAVAIKFLLPGALHNVEAVARFEREARAAVKIKSEHVARVSDVGRLDNGTPYMVMELMRGCDLSNLLQQSGPLAVSDVADYVLQAGEAIAEAHGLGIVHRDLKPQKSVSDAARGRLRLRQGARLRYLEDDRARLKDATSNDIDVGGLGLAIVHVTRAAHVGPRRRYAHGHLGVGCDLLRALDRQNAVRCRHTAAIVYGGHYCRSALFAQSSARRAGRASVADRALLGERSETPSCHGRRAGSRTGQICAATVAALG